MTITVKVKKIHENAIIPTKVYATDAGFDLHALEDTIIEPGKTAVIQTGLAFEIPEGYEMQIRPRSGISARTKLRVVLGTADSDFRGGISVIVDNINYMSGATTLSFKKVSGGDEYAGGRPQHRNTYIVHKGERIAQAVINKLPQVILCETTELSDSLRGTNGFGSSGV